VIICGGGILPVSTSFFPSEPARTLSPGDETIQSVLCGHSERLAIVFNLIRRPMATRIQIVKNLSICGDCREFNNYFIH
jgi:hypothetical protein